MSNEIFLDQLSNIENILDTEGRPLGEYKANGAIKSKIDFKLKQCQYVDNRNKHKHPMNVSALKQVMDHWDKVIIFFQSLRKHYYTYSKSPLNRSIDCLYFCNAIINIPAWLIYRAKDPIKNGHIPPEIAVMYKVAIGLNKVLQVIVSGEIMSGHINNNLQIDTDDLMLLIDHGGFLIGSEEVCAGPQKHIKEAVNAIMFDSKNTFSIEDSFLNSLIGDFNKYFSFSDSIVRISAAKYSMQHLSYFILYELNNAKLDLNTNIKSYIDVTINEFDNIETLNNLLISRSRDQLCMLIVGWINISHNFTTPLKKNNVFITNLSDLKDSKNKSTKIKKQASQYLDFEKHIIKIYTSEQQLFNQLLGYKVKKTTNILKLRPKISIDMFKIFNSIT